MQPKGERTFFKFSIVTMWEEVAFSDLKKGDIFSHSDATNMTFMADGDALTDGSIEFHQVSVEHGRGLH